MAAFGKGLMYYMLMCTDVSAILWIINDILMFVMFTKEQRKKIDDEETEEVRKDESCRMLSSMLGCKTDEQLALVLLILGTYIPGLNVLFWKGMLLGPFEKKAKLNKKEVE